MESLNITDNPKQSVRISESVLKKCFKNRDCTRIDNKSARQSAVIVLLVREESEWSVLLTQRSDKVQYHRNEVSFPGGMQELNDANLLATALREFKEETGVNPATIDVLGTLDAVDTTTGFIITPFVATIDHIPLMTLNKAEIEAYFLVPLTYLIQTNPTQTIIQYRGKSLEIDFYPWNNCRIWGATYRILRQLTWIVMSSNRMLD